MAENKTALGLPKNTTAALAYVLGWLSGLIVFLMEKEDKLVRFHAMQSIITFGAIHLLSIFVFPALFFSLRMFSFLYSLVSLGVVVLWVVLIIKTYQGEKIKLPAVGDFAEKQVEK